MKKLIKPQDILLLSLAGIGDLFEELKDPLMIVSNAYENVYGFVPRKYKRSNFIRTVQRSLKTGDIERIEKNGEVYLRLTIAGEKKTKRDFSLLTLAKKPWDGKWRVLFFDIEEKSKKVRERLRAKLKELGFGMIQKSAWITPHDIGQDIYEFLETNKMEDFVFLIEGKGLLAGDKKALARKIWKLNSLEEKYLDLEMEIMDLKRMATLTGDRRMVRSAKNKKQNLESEPARSEKNSEKRNLKSLKKKDLEDLKKKLKKDYLNLLLIDPILPYELLPENWVGERIKKEIKNLKG